MEHPVLGALSLPAHSPQSFVLPLACFPASVCSPISDLIPMSSPMLSHDVPDACNSVARPGSKPMQLVRNYRCRPMPPSVENLRQGACRVFMGRWPKPHAQSLHNIPPALRPPAAVRPLAGHLKRHPVAAPHGTELAGRALPGGHDGPGDARGVTGGMAVVGGLKSDVRDLSEVA